MTERLMRASWQLGLAAVLLAPAMFLYNNCTNSPPAVGSPPDVAAVATKLTDKIVLLRDGYNGYSGTRDTTVYIDPADWTSLLVVGNAPTGERAGTVIDTTQTNRQRAYGLLSFDVMGVADDLLKTGDTCAANVEVARATVDLFIGGASTGNLVYLEVMKLTAPAWTEADATYTMANATTAWPNTPNANQLILNSADGGYFDAWDGVANSGVYRHVTFDVPAEHVKSWICDPSTNRGLIMIVSSSVSTKVQFFTREFPERKNRPLLTLWLRRI